MDRSMERTRRVKELIANKNSMIYLDLKDIIKDHALPFLPAKSLFRFNGVCKDWKVQIRSPFFAHKQSTSFSDVSGFFLVSPPPSVPSFVSVDHMAYGVPDPSLKFMPEPVDLRASSNGMLCCQGREGDNAYYVCNPVTKQWKKLPKPNADHGREPALVLIFEPSMLSFVAEYKLVCAFPSVDFEGGHEFEIYSSKQGSWRISGEIIYGCSSVKPKSGVYANDIVYWQTSSRRVLSFDLKMERAQLGSDVSYSNGSVLGEMNGKLCSTQFNGANEIKISVFSNAYTNTMQMKSSVKAWSPKLTVNLNPAPEQGGGRGGSIVHASGNLVLYKNGTKLYAYNLRNKETLYVGDGSYNGIFFPHVNSLVEL